MLLPRRPPRRRPEERSPLARTDRAAPLRGARALCLVGMALGSLGSPWLDIPALGAIATVLYGVVALGISARVRRYGERVRQLGLPRGFQLDADGLPGLPAPGWSPEWVPFDLRLVEEAAPTGTVRRWRRILRADPAWAAVLAAQRRWLAEHAPARWLAVQRWWERVHRDPWVAAVVGEHPRASAHAAARTESSRALAVEFACGVAFAGQEALWGRALGMGAEAVELAELAAMLRSASGPTAQAPPFPRHRLAGRAALFIGRGFRCETRHSQRLEDLKLRDLSEVAEEPPEQGDPRIFGVGGEEAADRFLAETQFNQMVGILGATGVGKTRYAEVLLVQVIRLGVPLVVIDPKGDQGLTNRVVEECRRAGRAHQLRYFSLAAPRDRRSWAFLSRYNPCSTYTDPAELAARVASVLPSTKDPFWTNVAKAMAETCLSLCHWCHEYLRLLGRSDDGELPPHASNRVPTVIAAMQWARHHPTASPGDAGAAVEAIRMRLEDPAWIPPDEAAREVVAVLTTASLMGAPVYSPLEWVPTIRHVAEYGIDHTIPFLGWLLRIVHAHAYLDHERFCAPDIPRLASNPEIVSKGGRDEDGSLWSISQAERVHPLEARRVGAAELDQRTRRWVAFYDHFVPPRPGDAHDIGRIFHQLRAHLASLYSDATRERQKFLEYATTLQSAIKPFLGERSRIMCSVDTDIAWERVVAERQVVYCALASMVDDHGATACAKLIVQDLAAHFGRAYHYRSGEPSPVWLFADEAGSFINEPFIHLLNKCRGVGLRCIIAGQTRADLVRQLGPQGAQQVLGNLNTIIQLRSPEGVDAREFSERAGEALVVRESRSLSLTPTAVPHDLLAPSATAGAGRSWSPQAVKRIPPEAVMALPRGQAFVHTQGQVLLVAQGLMPDPGTDFAQEIGMHPGIMCSGQESAEALHGPRERAEGEASRGATMAPPGGALGAAVMATTTAAAVAATAETAENPETTAIAAEPPWPGWREIDAALADASAATLNEATAEHDDTIGADPWDGDDPDATAAALPPDRTSP